MLSFCRPLFAPRQSELVSHNWGKHPMWPIMGNLWPWQLPTEIIYIYMYIYIYIFIILCMCIYKCIRIISMTGCFLFNWVNSPWVFFMKTVRSSAQPQSVTALKPLRMPKDFTEIYHRWLSYLVMTNSLPWKDPPFLIGKPWENHGKMVISMVRSTIL